MMKKIVCIEKGVNVLSKVNCRTSSGPDQLCGKVIKECWLQLSLVIFKLYQSSIDNHDIPVIQLTAELVPVSKSNIPNVKNDLRPMMFVQVIS